MKAYKSNDLRRTSAEIFNEVQRNDSVLLTSRDRPNMVLIMEDAFNSIKMDLAHAQTYCDALFNEDAKTISKCNKATFFMTKEELIKEVEELRKSGD